MTLSFFVVPLLYIFAEQESLAFEGGAASIGELPLIVHHSRSGIHANPVRHGDGLAGNGWQANDPRP